MSYLPRAQEQMNGDLLLPEATKLFLHRLLRDRKADLAQAGDAAVLERTAVLALEQALGPCLEPLASVRDMLDLPDPQHERNARNLMTIRR